MLSTLFLLQATIGALPMRPPAPARTALPAAERPRGMIVTDPAGAPIGVVDASTPTMTTILVGARKIQLPANAFAKSAGRVTIPITSQQLDTLAALAANQQAARKTAAIMPPKGFVQPPRIPPGAPANPQPTPKPNIPNPPFK